MTATLLVPFGLREGRLYEPTQVLNGKACSCLCPACHSPLIARQNAKTPHFAHAQDENCSTGLETAVHMAAKQIIADKMKFRFPAISLMDYILFAKNKNLIQPHEYISLEKVMHETWNTNLRIKNKRKSIQAESTRNIEHVQLEKLIEDIRPDLIITSNGIDYIVEIAVTHFVEREKFRKIYNKRMPTIEVDVSNLKNGFTFNDLEVAIYSSAPSNATWIYHEILEDLSIKADKLEQSRLKSEEFDRLQKLEEEQSRQIKFQKYRDHSSSEKLEINLNAIALTDKQMEAFSVFVPWENSFDVCRIVWQSAIFAYFSKVEIQQDFGLNLPCQIDFDDCVYWLNDVFEINKIFKDSDKVAAWKYFKHLESIGILKFLSHKKFDLTCGRLEWNLLADKLNMKIY